MADLTSQLILSLVDKITEPLKEIIGSMRELNQTAQESQMAEVQDRANLATMAHASSMNQLRINMAEATAGAWAFYESLKSSIDAYAQYETAMMNFSQRVKLSDVDLDKFGKRLNEISLQVVQDSNSMIDNFGNLMTKARIGPDAALGVIKEVGMAATAYAGNLKATNETAADAILLLKVPIDQIGVALQGMKEAGREGPLAFKDLVSILPSITTYAARFGAVGLPGLRSMVSLLETAGQTAKSPQEAAASVNMLLQRALQPNVVKNFAKAKFGGINIVELLDKEKAKGAAGDVVATYMTALNAATRGGRPELVAELLGSGRGGGQAKLIEAWAKGAPTYAKTMHAQMMATIEALYADFEKRLNTTETRYDKIKGIMKDVRENVGKAIDPDVKASLESFERLMTLFDEFVTKNPEFVRIFVLTTGVFTALSLALAAVAYFGGIVATVLGSTGIAVGLVMAGLKLFLDNQEAIFGFFREFGRSVKENMGPETKAMLDGFSQGMEKVYNWFSKGSWKLFDESQGEAAGRSFGAKVAYGIEMAILEWKALIGQKPIEVPLKVEIQRMETRASIRDDFVQWMQAAQGGLTSPDEEGMQRFQAMQDWWHNTLIGGIKRYIAERDEIMRKGHVDMVGGWVTTVNGWLAELDAFIARQDAKIAEGNAKYKMSIVDTWTSIKTSVGGKWDEIVTSAKTAFDNIVTYCATLPDRIVAALASLPGRIAALIPSPSEIINKAAVGLGLAAPKPPPVTAPPLSVIGTQSASAEADLTALDKTQIKAGVVNESLKRLNEEVSPRVNDSQLISLQGVLDRINASLDEIGRQAAEIGQTTLEDVNEFSGRVRERLRTINSDALVQ